MNVQINKTSGELIDATWKFTDFMEFIREARGRHERTERSITSIRACTFNVGVSHEDQQCRRPIQVHANINVRRSKVRLMIQIRNKSLIPVETAVKMKVLCVKILTGEGQNCVVLKNYKVGQKQFDLKATHYKKKLFHETEAEDMRVAADDSLTIHFKIEVYITEPAQNGEHTLKKDTGSCQTDALKDFENLLKDTDTADVEIKVTLGETRSFRCHKSILAARSPVFRTMFNIPMKESIQSFVLIEDIPAEVVEHFISFLYCGRFQNPTWANSILELIYASDKYLVQSLKNICDENFMQCVNCENALALGKFAEWHNLTKATTGIRKYIAENALNLKLDTTEYEKDMFKLL